MDETSTVVGKALRIIDAFTPGEISLSLAEISRRTGLPKSTAHRQIALLESWNVLEREGDRLRLGMRLFEWGSLVPRQRAMRDAAIPFMEDLYEATHQTVHLGLLEGFDVVYIHKISGHQRARVPTSVGGRMPSHCTGLGKAMLAFSPSPIVESLLTRGLKALTPHSVASPGALLEQLEKIRTLGVAYEYEESVQGVSCVAAPIRNQDGWAVGAISVTGPSPNVTYEKLVPALRRATFGLSRALRGRI